jgi:uncharacterized membrane protein YdjX (TVP38/TMEM64 family)
MFAVSTGMTPQSALLTWLGKRRIGVEEIALWTILGVAALVGTLIAGNATYERMHRRRAQALGKRKKPKIQL